MRKILMSGTLIALLGAGALAQAKDITTTETGSPVEATRPVVRGDDYARERHFESGRGHLGARRGHRDDEAHERHDERWEHGRRHH